MKKETIKYVCDLCGASIEKEGFDYVINEGLNTKTYPIRGGFYGLFSQFKIKIFWFEHRWGRAFNSLCQDCAGAFTKVINERFNKFYP